LFGVRPITSVDYDIEADSPERGVGAEAMDPDVEDVDALCRENSGQLMQ